MTDNTQGTSLPNEADVILAAIESQQALLHTAIPAVVESYDHDTQTATVRPAVKFRKLEDGEFVLYTPPAIPSVPVAFHRATGYADTFPITVGDHGLVVFQERSTDEYRGTPTASADPKDPRRFDLSDAQFIPCQTSPASPIGATGRAAAARVIEAPEVLIGNSTATQFVALATDVLNRLQALEAWLNAHTHTGVTAGAGVTGGPSAPSPIPASVAATRVKAL